MAAPFFQLMGGVADTTLRFNLGGPDYTDTLGRLWKGYTNGSDYDYRAKGYANSDIVGTDDDPLYWTILYGSAPMVLPAPIGTYSIRAHYCEVFNTVGGQRPSGLLDRDHTTLITTFDIFNAAGGQNVAYQVAATFPAVADANGLLLYMPATGNENTTISAIEVLRLS